MILNKSRVAFSVFLIETCCTIVVSKKWSGVLPPGFQMVDGEAVDVTNKLIQMTTSQGTAYYSFDDPEGKPLYIREASESGWHYVAFDDPYNQDPGGGHLIVLQRMTGVSVGGSGKIVYEAFLMALEDSISAEVDKYDPQEADYYEDEDRENAKEDFDYIKDEARANGMRAPKVGTGRRAKRSQSGNGETKFGLMCGLKPFE
ncbi:unnamed protein product [Orchesella dallaii]|uniref:Uncharacterized protein n=1 Tax=Orchesella dallaii TaxID=48710 RepID=A0ABP1QRV5_9HEXA